jgi:hypothetical protein
MGANACVRMAVMVMCAGAPALGDVEYTVETFENPPSVLGFGVERMNDLGDVVGVALALDGNYAAGVRWADGAFDLLPPASPPFNGDEIVHHFAVEINNQRQILGFSTNKTQSFQAPWVYHDGTFTYPTTPFGDEFRPWDINDKGELVGGVPTGFFSWKAVYWSPQSGAVDILPDLSSIATSISENGWISGALGAGWRVRLGEEPLFFSEISQSFPAINDLGSVVGNGPGFGDPAHHEAYFYSDQTGEIFAANVGENDFGRSINNSDIAVGSSTGPSRGWVFTPAQGARLLDDLIDPALGLNITNARDINEKGEIVFGGYVVQTGESIRGVLRPIIACAADLDGNGVLDLFDFLAFTNLFNAGDLEADFETDGVLNLFDFLAFVNTFNEGC